jgi:hypothetical protein
MAPDGKPGHGVAGIFRLKDDTLDEAFEGSCHICHSTLTRQPGLVGHEKSIPGRNQMV